MGIGSGIVLFVIGAILAFALQIEVAWIDVKLVGYILMGAGALVFLISIVMLARRRQSESVTRTSVDPTVGEQVTRRTTTTSDDVI